MRTIEPPRILRRLHCLREWSYEEASKVFPRSYRARRAHGQRVEWPVRIAVGSDRVHRGKNRLHRETLRRWVRQHERDTGQRPGTTTAEQQQIKALEREVRELRKANEILRLASAFFAQAELDHRFKP